VTYFTDGPIVRKQRDISEFGSSLGEVFGAAFEQGIAEDPILGASSELDDAQLGQPIIGEQLPEGVHVPRHAPNTPLLSADEARARVKESGLPLTIAGDIREGALDILMRRKQEELQRQVILSSGPRGSVPVSILAGFAASAIDPLNITSAFIPVVGEARYARMLANASGVAGRAGVRAGVGALEGAVGAALVEPLVLSNAREYQADYDMSDSLANIAFGSVLGAGLHSLGGAYSDWRQSRLRETPPTRSEIAVPEMAAAADVETRALDVPEPDVGAIIAKQMQEDISLQARQRAVDELMPAMRAELETQLAGRTPVRELKTEQADITRTLDSIDDSFKDRAKAFQEDGLTRKQAEKAAREAIKTERADLNERLGQIESTIEQNRTAEKAGADLSVLQRGEVPERYLQRVADREQMIRQGVAPKPLAGAVRLAARDIAESAPHMVRQNAFKAAVAQAMSGRDIDVEHIFNLAKQPENSLQRIAEPPVRSVDKEAVASSQRADEITKSAKDDQTELEESAAFDEEMAQSVADQLGIDLKAELKAVDAMAKDAETYTKAWRAAAICSMRQ
jgi:hypothetical protein